MDTMDLDMEMEVEVDLVPDEPIVPEAYLEDLAPRSPGEVTEDPEAIAPTKVHIRGLDVLNPKELKAYVAEHFPETSFSRIEWIDDTSANLLFGAEDVASRALAALAAETIVDVAGLPLKQLLPAKPFSQRPEVALQVRRAVWGDKKQQGAAQRSRFYLLNPEYDPEERARRRGETRRYRDRDGGDDYGRRQQQPRRTREDEPKDHFDVNLYDDDEAALATRSGGDARSSRRRRSYTPDSDDGGRRRASPGRRENAGKELFPLGGDATTGREPRSRRNGASRDRSRSPIRDRDGDRDMDGFASDASAARNRDRARAVKSHMQRSNRARELFPTADKGDGRLGDKLEDATELLAKGIMLPLMDGSNDVPSTTTSSRSQSRRLEDRISAPGQGGRLADRISDPAAGGSAFSIRGAASKESADQGFAIKGMGKSARELFPDKFGGGSTGNENKELFGNRGGARNRKKAGDLFD
ncbi:uncharacterized protein B0I36DRAFT_320113 [Microdochium trichocladiopsis]|uniref:Uncharacterized protein n=1 Tax=Microdochium trichocladiopsis TaxID=1682393 RepID=A0A9P8Y8U1_9PEZI|nr:uncharacterized protein B0I36DRAFT_320113 [Microdochium trichocladiopsis]KAH7032826.1 hypothetical protein B0I36DRAFT_320113 [Microdochium trichocladiopsis]